MNIEDDYIVSNNYVKYIKKEKYSNNNKNNKQ